MGNGKKRKRGQHILSGVTTALPDSGQRTEEAVSAWKPYQIAVALNGASNDLSEVFDCEGFVLLAKKRPGEAFTLARRLSNREMAAMLAATKELRFAVLTAAQTIAAELAQAAANEEREAAACRQ